MAGAAAALLTAGPATADATQPTPSTAAMNAADFAGDDRQAKSRIVVVLRTETDPSSSPAE